MLLSALEGIRIELVQSASPSHAVVILGSTQLEHLLAVLVLLLMTTCVTRWATSLHDLLDLLFHLHDGIHHSHFGCSSFLLVSH